MKWGVRRYQNDDGTLTPLGKKREASQYTKQLNKQAQTAAERKADVIRYDTQYHQHLKKADAFKKSHDVEASEYNAKRLQKITDKMNAAGAKRDAHANTLKDVESYTHQQLDKIQAKGYSVNSKDMVRMTKLGEQFVATMIGPDALSIAIVNRIQVAQGEGRYRVEEKNGMTWDQTPWMVKGKSYRVT